MKGLDCSFSSLPQGWAEARVAEGYKVFVQCLWTGGYANKVTVAEWNLSRARAAGMITCGYLNTNPWFPASVSMAESKKNAGAEWPHLRMIFNDIEIANVTEAQCKEHTEAIVAAGYETAIYSAKWFWDSLGNPKWPWLKAYDIWVADYDGDPNLATSQLFGPWNLSDVMGKQYTNTTNLAGVQVDINEFADEFFEEDDMGLTTDEHNWLKATHDILTAKVPGPFWQAGGNPGGNNMTWHEMVQIVYAVLTDDATVEPTADPRFAYWTALMQQGALPGASADAQVIAEAVGEELAARLQE